MKETSMMRLRSSPALLALLLAIALFFLGGLIQPGFVNAKQAANIIRLASLLGIVAIGQTLVIISGGEGIDLSVGAVLTLGAILTYRFSNGQDNLILLGLLTSLLAGAGIGFINGLGISYLKIPPLVMTLGMAGVVQGTVLAVTQGTLLGGTPPLLVKMVAGTFLGIPGSVIFWLVLALLVWVLLERFELW